MERENTDGKTKRNHFLVADDTPEIARPMLDDDDEQATGLKLLENLRMALFFNRAQWRGGGRQDGVDAGLPGGDLTVC